MSKTVILKRLLPYSFILISFLLLSTGNLFALSKIWAGSWSCAPYAVGPGNTPPPPYLANNTLRQVVRVSIGGDTLRIKFSNKTCATSTTMNSVNIAVSTGGSSIDASTIQQLKFNGNSSVTMDEFSSVTSDPVAFNLTPGSRVAITIYYGQAASTMDMTGHVGSRTDSYILSGNRSSSADFNGAVETAHWYTISSIDVRAPKTAGSVGILGNSITDGYGLSGGLQNRWTDFFSEALLSNSSTQDVGVLNLGIGGTNVAGAGPTTGISRYQQDILGQSGLRWFIIFYGTNDIAGGASASTIINAYQKMIEDAHAKNIKVYGATITPFNGSGHYSIAREETRNAVNNWIRTPGNFDAVIDFDETIRDPNNPSRLLADYSNDWLHPNVAGYKLLGESVDPNLFIEINNDYLPIANAGEDQTLIDHGNKGSRSVNLDGSGSYDFGETITSYVWSEGANEIATGENPTLNLPFGTHVISLTVTDVDGNSDSDDVIITIIKDSGVWIDAECGNVGSLWNIESDGNASNGKYVIPHPGNISKANAPTDDSAYLSFTFDIKESGLYTIWARVICPSPNDDSFWIKIDDNPFAMWNGLKNSPFWLWDSYPSAYNLGTGSHTLTLAYREDGAKLDKLWITKTNSNNIGKGSVDKNCSVTGMPTGYFEQTILSPNPVSGLLNVSLSGLPSILTIYNINGKELLNQETICTNLNFDMTKYLPGLYLIKITTLNKTILKRIIKN